MDKFAPIVGPGHQHSLVDAVALISYPRHTRLERELAIWLPKKVTATAGSDVVQSGRPNFDDFFQHLWPYIGNNTANVVFQMVKRLWPIRIDQ
ncbi:hypothetical protein TNCV_644051 [Trichonephila clavipes]|nr:hypothetical protein TNCV_644051 [Trichonephila clavipes]